MENNNLLINPTVNILAQIPVAGPRDYFIAQLEATAVVWNYNQRLSKQLTITKTQVNTSAMTVSDPNIVEFKASLETIGTISKNLVFIEYRKVIDECGIQITGQGVSIALPSNTNYET